MITVLPVNFSRYCGSPGPKLETKSAHCAVVHSNNKLPGESLSVSDFPNVGVGSVDGGSDSVGEVSSSVWSIGEVMTLLSYSSSASESA